MGQAGPVFGVGVGVVEVVVPVVEAGARHHVGQLAARQGSLSEAGVHAGLVERERVGRGEHAHVGDDRCVVARMTVAGGGDVADQRDVEGRPSVHHGLGVFGHAAVELLHGRVLREVDGVEVAGADAAAAAHAVRVVDRHLLPLLVEDESVVGAFAHAAPASAAAVLIDHGLAVAVLVLLAGAGAAAHADVLDRAAESRHLVPLEVGERDEYVGVHDGVPYFRLLDVLASLHGYGYVVGALESVGDDHRAPDGQRRESVLPGAPEVLEGVLAAAGVEGVAVGQEGLSSQLRDHVHHRTRIVGAQEGHVAEFAEVHLDGHELAVHVDVSYPGRLDQALELVGRPLVRTAAKTSVINLGHSRVSKFQKPNISQFGKISRTRITGLANFSPGRDLTIS